MFFFVYTCVSGFNACYIWWKVTIQSTDLCEQCKDFIILYVAGCAHSLEQARLFLFGRNFVKSAPRTNK